MKPSTAAVARAKRVLTTPPSFPREQPRLQTNLDTDLLKLVAIAAMFLDHFGDVFFPGVGIFRWVGRIAFPIFCYCMTVGLLYTRDIKKYLGRLALFAVVSQPFYLLAFHPYDWQQEWANWNIFFTLFLSLLAMYGLKERKWWLFFLGLFVVSWWNFDYSGLGIQLMLIFYLCRNKPKLGAVLFCLTYATSLFWGDSADPLSLTLGGWCIDWTFFAIFAAPLIFCRTHSGVKISKYVFYVFYPAHLLLIGILRLALNL